MIPPDPLMRRFFRSEPGILCVIFLTLGTRGISVFVIAVLS